MVIEAIIVGAGGRGSVYSQFALHYPQELKIVGVAEPNLLRREQIVRDHQLPTAMIFEDWQTLLQMEKPPNTVILNCTMDRLHFASTMAMLEAGYDVLLEKPMSPILHENIKLVRRAEELGRWLQICHVLRYSPFWQKLAEVVASGVLGRIISVSHEENLAYWHMAHSFVRGNWRNEAIAGPMLLSKCCHDFDILHWLLRKKVRWLSSLGALVHFHADNAPTGATAHCVDGCAVLHECKYAATRWYANAVDDWLPNAVTPQCSTQARLEALKISPYGRCVYHCDNDVVDYQVVNMTLEDDISVTLTMNGHGDEECRTFRYNGTSATLYGKFAENTESFIHIHHHHNNHVEVVAIPAIDESGHGGGDFGILRSFLNALTGNPDSGVTTARESLESHLLAFAAEEARQHKTVINMQNYRLQVEAETQHTRLSPVNIKSDMIF